MLAEVMCHADAEFKSAAAAMRDLSHQLSLLSEQANQGNFASVGQPNFGMVRLFSSFAQVMLCALHHAACDRSDNICHSSLILYPVLL